MLVGEEVERTVAKITDGRLAIDQGLLDGVPVGLAIIATIAAVGIVTFHHGEVGPVIKLWLRLRKGRRRIQRPQRPQWHQRLRLQLLLITEQLTDDQCPKRWRRRIGSRSRVIRVITVAVRIPIHISVGGMMTLGSRRVSHGRRGVGIKRTECYVHGKSQVRLAGELANKWPQDEQIVDRPEASAETWQGEASNPLSKA